VILNEFYIQQRSLESSEYNNHQDIHEVDGKENYTNLSFLFLSKKFWIFSGPNNSFWNWILSIAFQNSGKNSNSLLKDIGIMNFRS